MRWQEQVWTMARVVDLWARVEELEEWCLGAQRKAARELGHVMEQAYCTRCGQHANGACYNPCQPVPDLEGLC